MKIEKESEEIIRAIKIKRNKRRNIRNKLRRKNETKNSTKIET